MSSKMSLIAFFCVMGLALILPSHAQDEKQEYLDSHNAARKAVGVPPLTWNQTLADYAQNYANKLESTNNCQLKHSEGSPYGENLAWSSAPELTATAAVQLWVEEIAFYDYKTNSCQADKMCGHYTQVVWNTTEQVGCAKALCKSGGALFSCNYFPTGNFVGVKPY
ncbi:hypothetical protein Tsubulata_009232 [Turnera subulata]|uniref:SCP domain-containing protein n=1 Tax=Turnera subulata TaxID=218843 RepID=A0A9Q0F3N1_9ROSI|nr:hypothetical protein Tsubulata_009232 [Turnera subulata]